MYTLNALPPEIKKGLQHVTPRMDKFVASACSHDHVSLHVDPSHYGYRYHVEEAPVHFSSLCTAHIAHEIHSHGDMVSVHL